MLNTIRSCLCSQEAYGDRAMFKISQNQQEIIEMIKFYSLVLMIQQNVFTIVRSIPNLEKKFLLKTHLCFKLQHNKLHNTAAFPNNSSNGGEVATRKTAVCFFFKRCLL